jgi:hypothetical protein
VNWLVVPFIALFNIRVCVHFLASRYSCFGTENRIVHVLASRYSCFVTENRIVHFLASRYSCFVTEKRIVLDHLSNQFTALLCTCSWRLCVLSPQRRWRYVNPVCCRLLCSFKVNEDVDEGIFFGYGSNVVYMSECCDDERSDVEVLTDVCVLRPPSPVRIPKNMFQLCCLYRCMYGCAPR